MAEEELYHVPFGPPPNLNNRNQSNPQLKQWQTHYSSSYSTIDPRMFVEMDLGESYTRKSTWVGGPSTNDLVEHAREHCGYWTHANGPNLHDEGESTTENNFMLAKIANNVDKLVYNMGHKSQMNTNSSKQRGSSDYCVIGYSGMFKPRSDKSGNGHASFGVDHLYMFYNVGSSEGYYQSMLEAITKFLQFLECIAATPDGDSPDVEGCYNSISGFGAVDKDLQRRVIVDLLEQYDLNYGVKIASSRIPNIPGLPINEIIEILQEIVDIIFDKIDEIIAEVTQYIVGLTRLVAAIVEAFQNIGLGEDANLSVPEFIAKLHQEPQSGFPMGQRNWPSLPSEAQQWYCGTVTPFVSRTVALMQLNCNGMLLVMSANKKSGVGSADRRMEVYDWMPIYAPGGGRRTEPKCRKIVPHFDRRKFPGFIEPRTSTHIELFGVKTTGYG